MKAGYLYVLVHPSDPKLFKIGQTTRHPDERLVEHNCNDAELAGRIVKETGQKWKLKTFIAVPDVNWAEIVFWSATGLADIPYRGGVEIERMEWKLVEVGLKAAEKAGVRPVPKVYDYVYANTAWVKKRLEGRGITLVGMVKSKRSGRNNFRCNNGHEWRTTPSNVAEGEGCPECGMGERTPEQIRQGVVSGVLCLLTHPDKPGLVKIGLTYGTLEESWAGNVWGDWEVHRYRNVEEPDLAETLMWELLGFPLPHDRQPISIDLHVAEQAFCEMHARLDSRIASAEMSES